MQKRLGRFNHWDKISWWNFAQKLAGWQTSWGGFLCKSDFSRAAESAPTFAMLWTVSLCALCALCASSVLGAPVNNERQKVLLISFDGFRWDYDRDVDTPNLDRMAEDGVKAQYVTPPYLTITSPTHFTLLTGKVSFSTAALLLSRGSAYHDRGVTALSLLCKYWKSHRKKELVVIECPRVQRLL